MYSISKEPTHNFQALTKKKHFLPYNNNVLTAEESENHENVLNMITFLETQKY